jgi:hypothetical protein
MTASGKQVLLRVLRDLSSKHLPKEEEEGATKRLRAALLMHGSTSDENFHMVNRLSWGTIGAEAGSIRQGVATHSGKVLIADLYERMLQMPGLENFCREAYPDLTEKDYEAGTWAIWLIISAVQMFAELLSVETNEKDLDIEPWIEGYSRKFDLFLSELEDVNQEEK